jgi:heptosyltransferase-3
MPLTILYIAEADPMAAVMSSGVLARMVEEAPDARFTIVGSPDSAPLFRHVPGLDRVIVLPSDGKADWFKLWDRLKDRRWGLVVDMRGSRLSGWLKRDKRAVRMPNDEVQHAVEAAAQVLRLETPSAPLLFFGDEVKAAADALIAERPGPILAMGPGVDWIGKRWPSERFTKVAAALIGDAGPMAGGRLMLVGSGQDRDAAHTIRFAVSRDKVIELQGKLDLLETAAALRHSRMFIGGDSIWTQLAVAAGVPALGVYGPSDETITRPWTGAAVRGSRSVEEFRIADPELNQHIQHMMDVPVEPVVAAALKLYQTTEPPVLEPAHG